MPMFTLQNDNQFVIQRGGVKFVVVETRGDTAVAYATREPLPYAVFCQERLIARVDSRVLATAILDHQEATR